MYKLVGLLSRTMEPDADGRAGFGLLSLYGRGGAVLVMVGGEMRGGGANAAGVEEVEEVENGRKGSNDFVGGGTIVALVTSSACATSSSPPGSRDPPSTSKLLLLFDIVGVSRGLGEGEVLGEAKRSSSRGPGFPGEEMINESLIE